MKKTLLILLILYFICFVESYAFEPVKEISPNTKPKELSLEEKYIKTRDGFISRFSKANNIIDIDDSQALLALEKQIRTIIGPINIEGFPKQSKINLETLLTGELGFDQVDGLRFESGQETLFVTNEELLKSYLGAHPELPKDLKELSKNDHFYSSVFHSDAMVTYYAEIPVKRAIGQYFVHAFLGLIAQDIGPFIPKEIYVFVSMNKNLLLVHSQTAIEIPDIKVCKSEWDKFEEKSLEAYESYRSSKLKDEKAIDDSFKYEQEGFEAYCNCYGKEVKNHKIFIEIEKQAQSIVDRLHVE